MLRQSAPTLVATSPFLELKNLYQMGTLQEYLDQFDVLLNKVLHKVEANDEMVLS